MQRKIFFNIVVVLLLGVIISGLLSARIVKKNLLSDIEKSLTTEAALVRELLGESLINNSNDIGIYVGKIKQTANSRITIVDVMGNVIIDTDKEYSEMENHAGRPEIAAALKGEAESSIRYSSTLRVDFIYVAQPILKGSSIIGAVRLSKPLYEVKNMLNSLYINVFIAVLIGIFVASVLGYKMAMNITKPIKEITYTASRIAKGQLDRRINITSRNEIGILADSINDMASKLRDTITSLQDKNIKLESIMSSMINGIIAIDNSEKILFINHVAESLLGITGGEITGKHLLQVVRNNSIDNYFKKMLKDKEFFNTEVNLNDSNEKILKFHANSIKQNGENGIEGIIITIQDVTELRKLERVRTEFIANVSHELKTPLTSIKGFTETLKSFDFDDKQDAIRFLNIIEDEADRLYRLINDILSLSELEQKKTKTVKEKIDIEKAVEEVLSVLKSQSDKKNIELSAKIQEGLESISGDGDKFKQMLINLIDNAVKYTPENGKVSIEAYKQSHNADLDKLIIKVKDNGIGIPKQHIPRLFERFYRVDKARSRTIGGTGLGLAIVKHIVMLFNGEIEVTSEVGKGTEFRIILPMK
ncbi:MAG TPA: ATP-binding protein [Bacillota bacterium]|nr:ATP-binding protein [Clostridiaceae bacterium]HNR03795.1 ATP-binding protein [Bacillota bacterium]HNT03161.1 ATP-binding protein [Bacillota bacterium]HPX68343.1 ATP-binding protein [Bacillota bacterium]HQA65431.1 ATP-binding protein [Bacillota bacterium]